MNAPARQVANQAAIACQNCRHFHGALTSVKEVPQHVEDDKGRLRRLPNLDGECRATPPTIATGDLAEHSWNCGWRIWPAVRCNDWCSAYEPSPEMGR